MEPTDLSSHAAVVITVSDEVASGDDTDRGGPVAVDLLQRLGLFVEHRVVPDEPSQISASVTEAISRGARVVVASGGTGLGPRDLTSQTISDLLSFEIPGIGEEIRRRGAGHTPVALLSREVAGAVVGEGHLPALVLAIPGSRGGVRDALAVLSELLGYIIDQLDGAGHR